MIKKLLTITMLGAALVACGGVDRDGTRDNIVEGLESSGIAVEGECVDNALDEFSDDELKEIEDQLEDGDYTGNAETLLNALLGCADVGS